MLAPQRLILKLGTKPKNLKVAHRTRSFYSSPPSTKIKSAMAKRYKLLDEACDVASELFGGGLP